MNEASVIVVEGYPQMCAVSADDVVERRSLGGKEGN